MRPAASNGESNTGSPSADSAGATDTATDVGTAAQVFTLTSGAETYWTSTDRQTDSSDSRLSSNPASW